MNDLIEALQILAKYDNPNYPTHCDDETLMIMGIYPEDVSEEDIEKLDKLGFFVFEEGGEKIFMSFRFGGA